MKRQPVGLVHDGCRLARRVFAAGVEVFNEASYHHRLGDHSDDAQCPIAHGQRLMSISNTRRSRAIQLIGALASGSSSVVLARVRERLDLTMSRRLRALGANSP